MEIQTIVMLAVLLIYNVATVKLLAVTLARVDLGKAVIEKASDPPVPLAGADPSAAASPRDTSYSRVTGMIGAVVLATFFWGVGNVVLCKAFTQPDKIGDLLTGMGSLFAGGAALFLPYAFNQAREAFAPRK